MLAVLIALFAVALPGTASAVTVTSIADNLSNQPLIPGTLRHAIATAPNNDTITFSSSLKGKTITLKGGQLVLNRSLTIRGLGVDRLAVSGANASRVFLVANAANATNATAVIADLTITKGNNMTAALTKPFHMEELQELIEVLLADDWHEQISVDKKTH